MKSFFFKHQKIILPLAISALVLGMGILYGEVEKGRDRIHPGIFVSGIKVGGMTKEEAYRKVHDTLEGEEQTSRFRLKSDVTSYFYTPEELGLQYGEREGVDAAYAIGRKGGEFQKTWDILYTTLFTVTVPLEPRLDPLVRDGVVQELADKVYAVPQDAIFSYIGGEISVSKERPGKYLDMPETQELLDELVKEYPERGKTGKDLSADLPIYTTDPHTVREDFQRINGIIGEFETDYHTSENNRKHNIAKGAETISNRLIRPGEEISFNDTIGEISIATGYKTAGVIINGEFDRGVGGGICQVSTTLYNALIRGEVEIVERYNHSRPITYVPKGTDAAVARGYKDLKFKNTFDYPIYITSHADGKILHFTVFGDTTGRDYTIEIEPILLGTQSPRVIRTTSGRLGSGEVEVEQSGSKGYYYKTLSHKVKNGEVISTQEISTSSYPAQDRIVVVGVGDSGDDR